MPVHLRHSPMSIVNRAREGIVVQVVLQRSQVAGGGEGGLAHAVIIALLFRHVPGEFHDYFPMWGWPTSICNLCTPDFLTTCELASRLVDWPRDRSSAGPHLGAK